jgi:hypothetical protein
VTFGFPDEVFGLTPVERRNRVAAPAKSFLLLDGERPFLRVLLPVRLDVGHEFRFGVWLEVHENDFKRAWATSLMPSPLGRPSLSELRATPQRETRRTRFTSIDPASHYSKGSSQRPGRLTSAKSSSRRCGDLPLPSDGPMAQARMCEPPLSVLPSDLDGSELRPRSGRGLREGASAGRPR